MRARRFIMLVATALTAQAASAAVISGWNFSTISGGLNQWGASPLAATTTATGVTGSGLARGAGVQTPYGVQVPGQCWGGTGFVGTNTDAALNGRFISFTVTASSGKTLSLESIGAYSVRRDLTGAAYGQWQYQVGGGAFVDLGFIQIWGSDTTAAGNPQQAISLTGIAALQQVPANVAVTFRLLNWGAIDANGGWYLNRLTTGSGLDFALNGSVQPMLGPAPGAAGLLALAAARVSRRRRA